MHTAIRLANPDDIPVFVALMAAFYAEAGYPLDRDWATGSFSRLLHAPALGCVWLLEHGGQPVGYVVLTVRFAMEFGGLDGFIDDLFVCPAARRQGLADLALRTLLAECRGRGVLALHVEVGRDNAAANALYAKFGLRSSTDGRQLLTRVLGEA